MSIKSCDTARALLLAPLFLALAACSSLKEESGVKTDYNSETGRFETGPYASASIPLTGGNAGTKPVSEKALDKSRRK